MVGQTVTGANATPILIQVNEVVVTTAAMPLHKPDSSTIDIALKFDN